MESVCTVGDVTIRDSWYEQIFTPVGEIPERYPQFHVDILNKYVSCSMSDVSDDPWKLGVPKDRRRGILFQCHDTEATGHLGVEKTNCKTCTAQKPEKRFPAEHIGSRPAVTCPYQLITSISLGYFLDQLTGIGFCLWYAVSLASLFCCSLLEITHQKF